MFYRKNFFSFNFKILFDVPDIREGADSLGLNFQKNSVLYCCASYD